MTGNEARSATVADELARAEECLAEARYAIQGGFYRLVRGRAYYAVDAIAHAEKIVGAFRTMLPPS